MSYPEQIESKDETEESVLQPQPTFLDSSPSA